MSTFTFTTLYFYLIAILRLACNNFSELLNVYIFISDSFLQFAINNLFSEFRAEFSCI